MIRLECIDGPLWLNPAHVTAVEPFVTKAGAKGGANCTVYLSTGVSYGIKEYASQVVDRLENG